MIPIRDVPSSLWATAVFRMAGARSAIVTVDGKYPVLVTAGSITCGRLFLRCKTIPVEVGAGENGSLALGERVFINTGATIVANHSTEIGDDCRIGDLVAIFDSEYIPWNRRVRYGRRQFVLAPTSGSPALRQSFQALPLATTLSPQPDRL